MTRLVWPNEEHPLPIPQRRRRDILRRAADVLVDELVQAGVEVVFGIPGGATVSLFDSLVDHPEIRVVVTRHEGNAVFAAAGYAQVTGKLGVVIVTSGPGTLNTMNGIGSAFADGLPVLILAGEAARTGFGKGAIQEGSVYAANVVGMASKITKMALEIPEPNAVAPMLRRAMATAQSGKKGPVFLSLPLNVLGARVSPPRVALEVSTRFELSSHALDDVVKALSAPQKRVILAGSGLRWGDGPMLLREVAERLQCPVMTTPKAKGVFPESHALALGIFGMGGHPSTRDFLADGVDVVLVLGSSLNEVATDGWSPLLSARRSLIHVDIDAARIGRVYPTDIALSAPAEAFLSEILPRLPEGPPAPPCGITYDRDPIGEAQGTEGRISAPRALWELQQKLPPDTIYTGDSGTNLFFAAHYLKVDRPDGFVAMLGLGSMGSSLGAAMGACLAHPARTVVSICGDGGFLMSAAEISTAAAQGLPLIVMVLNDERLGMVEFGHTAICGRTPPFPTTPLRVDKWASACGAGCWVINQPDQLLAMDLMGRPVDRPLVLDVHIDKTVTIPANKRFQTIRDKLKRETHN